jgi:hypothetical protein
MSYGITVADLWSPNEKEIKEDMEVFYIMDTPVANYTGSTAKCDEVADKMGPFKTMLIAVKAAQKRMMSTNMGTHLLAEKYGKV